MAALVPSVDVYYWPMMGRAGAVMHMLNYAKIPYTHKSDFGDIASIGSAFGSSAGDTFAPPIVVDGDVTVSQSIACCVYIGKKCGLVEGLDEIKALQYLLDIVDAFENGVSKASMEGGAQLKAFFEGDRYVALCSHNFVAED